MILTCDMVTWGVEVKFKPQKLNLGVECSEGAGRKPLWESAEVKCVI